MGIFEKMIPIDGGGIVEFMGPHDEIAQIVWMSIHRFLVFHIDSRVGIKDIQKGVGT